jgi:hypothetical protein
MLYRWVGFGFIALALLAPRESRADDLFVTADGRAGVGLAKRFDDPTGSVALELGAGLRIATMRAPEGAWVWAVLPEVSYAGLYTHHTQLHSGVLGIGLGKTDRTFLLGIIPGFVFDFDHRDDGSQQRGYGGRVLLTAEIIHWVGIQAAYQVTAIDGRVEQDVRATVSLNFIGLLVALLIVSHG